jgi:tetratricopeptide (TPR) repeat protein
MMNCNKQLCLVIGIVVAIASCSRAPEQTSENQASGDVFGESVGTVNLPVECRSDAAATVQRGVALLHHMTYASARKLFEEAAEADPRCAMALWGIAMTYIHPLWQDRPTPEILARGAELASKARSLDGISDREQAYVETIGAYFDDGDGFTERERLVRFEAAWRRVHEANPQDLEAKAFFALAYLALADPDDKTYEIQRAAGAMAEEVLAAAPDHPGAHHYIIHSYDYPPLAELALPVARNYGKIAPEVPHALHMTSHIFTRRGLWDESIAWNKRSAAAALRMSEALGAVSMHYQHALDYLAYAYLQKAMDKDASEVVDRVASLTPPFHEVNRKAAAHAFAAIPARYALERHDWAAASVLEPRVPAEFPWEETHLEFIAMTHFGRSLGMAHEGRFEDARREISILDEFETKIGPRTPYWAKQVEIQRLGALAWIRFLEGDKEGGLDRMREAAALEATTEKAPVTPGEVLPAAELLGDMLLELGRYREARTAYDTSLARSPNRFNSLFGAGRSAELEGDADGARDYYRRLVAFSTPGESGRERLTHARQAAAR